MVVHGVELFIKKKVAYYDSEYKPSSLESMDDVLDGFENGIDKDKKQICVYFRPEETKALKYLALDLEGSVSMSEIVQIASDKYDYTEEDIALYREQKDRDGSKMSTIYLGVEIRLQHQAVAKGLGLTGNQYYRMCLNGFLKKIKRVMDRESDYEAFLISHNLKKQGEMT